MSLREGPLLKAFGGQPRHIDRSTLLRYASKVVLVGGAYYVAAVLGLRLALIERNVTPLWPPTGIAVVALLILGWRVWPGVALAALAVNLPISTNGLAAAATAAGNTLAPVVAALLLVRVGFRREIDRLQDALAIVFLAALLSMLISASIGTGTLVLSGAIPASKFLAAWAVWWTGDAMGVLVVAPFLLVLFQRPWSGSLRERTELGALLLLVATVSVLVMNTDLQLMFLVDPIPRLDRMAVPAAWGGPGSTARCRDRFVGCCPRHGPLPTGHAVREDDHPPIVQRDRGVLIIVLRRSGDRTNARS